MEGSDDTPGGMKSTSGSQGELADRGGTPGFPQSAASGGVQSVSGQSNFGGGSSERNTDAVGNA